MSVSSSSSSSSFYSAPDSPSSVTSQIHPQAHPPTPTPRTPMPHPRANEEDDDDDDHNPLSTPPSERWLSRIASSAGKVIAAVLGLADESDESEWDVISCYEEKYEIGKRIEKPYAVEESKAGMPVVTSEEELVTQETLSREQGAKPVRPAQSLNVRSSSPLLHPKDVFSHKQLVQVPVSPVQASVKVQSVPVAEAKEQFEKNKSSSPGFQLPLNPNTYTLPGKTKELPLTNTNSTSIPPMNPLPFQVPYQNQQHQLSTIITPVKPTRLLDKFEELGSQETLPREQSEKLLNPAQSLIVESSSPLLHPTDVFGHKQVVQVPASPVQVHSFTEAMKQFEENKTSSPSFELPVNSNTSVLPGNTKELRFVNRNPPLNPNLDHCLTCSQNQQVSDIIPPISPLLFPLPNQNQQQQLSTVIPPVNHMPSPSLSPRRLPPSLCAPLLNPNAASTSLNQKQKEPHPSIPNPCFKRIKTDFQCSLASSNCKVPEKDIPELTVEEGSGAKRWASNLKAVIELFSGDFNAKQPGDMDLLSVLEMKGIKFEDPSWWPK